MAAGVSFGEADPWQGNPRFEGLTWEQSDRETNSTLQNSEPGDVRMKAQCAFVHMH